MSEDEFIDKIMKGEVKAHELGALLGSEEKAAAVRRAYLRKRYGTALENAAKASMDYEDAGSRNIENMIGSAQVPLSYVEISVKGDYAKGEGKHPVYMATTEGRLVAGVTRGASAISASGGARTAVLDDKMTRSILLDTGGIEDARKVISFVNSGEGSALIKGSFSGSTKHGEFLGIDCYTTGRRVFLVYRVSTKAAMGMNMVTIAANRATREAVALLGSRGVKCRIVSESGNMCVDKKPAAINTIRGRGVSVVAEVVIPRAIVKERLKAEPEAIVEVNYAKNYVGSAYAGSLGHNGHVANMLAAIFIAYGQDVAQVVDGANAIDDAAITENGDLYFSVFLPSLEVGTFGGGTKRETQMELLKSSGVYGEGDSTGATKRKFAELVAAVCLAGEVNLLASEATGQVTKAHSSIKR
jgi:hydroxymethylglutaryl-CoA reductase (NADPH)